MPLQERLADEELAELAAEGRWHVLATVAEAGVGHIGGPMSAMDVLVSLYFDTLRVDPGDPDAIDRDRFILSKGHSAIGLYSVLAMRGYFPVDELATFDQGDSRLQGHPDMRLLPGVDASTGSLGQGLAAGAGMALAARMRGADWQTWVLIGDGELQEGMIWEAVHFSHRHRLGNLIAVLDLNGLQQFGSDATSDDRFDRADPWRGVDLATVFAGMGWRVVELDGNDIATIRQQFRAIHDQAGTADRPTMVLARTAKGHGVSFTRGTYKWHNGVPTAEQLATARAELGVGDVLPSSRIFDRVEVSA